jgi:hypothetical protein
MEQKGEVKMIAYIKEESEMEILDYLRRYGYTRIIAIYPKGNQIVCWFES